MNWKPMLLLSMCDFKSKYNPEVSTAWRMDKSMISAEKLALSSC